MCQNVNRFRLRLHQTDQDRGSSTYTVKVYGSSTVVLQCPRVSGVPWPGFGWGRLWRDLAAGWRALESHVPLQRGALQKRRCYAVGRVARTLGDWRTVRESEEWRRMWDSEASRSSRRRYWSVHGGGPWGVGCYPVGNWSVLSDCPSSRPLFLESQAPSSVLGSSCNRIRNLIQNSDTDRLTFPFNRTYK